ncbi:DUF4369 domain-containing protein [Puia sp. P3]|uniref:DUF4369 domain-containing protein n=1 Tax=Puia sp. P3 TaxID=3423952 RepID=UPI003D66E080
MLILFGAAALSLTLVSATAGRIQRPETDSTYTLTGTIDGLKNGWVYLRHGQTEKIDSVKAASGKFSFSGTIGDPEFCRLAIIGASGTREYRTEFFLEKGNLQVKANKGSMEKAVIGGTPVQDEFRQYQEKRGRRARGQSRDSSLSII